MNMVHIYAASLFDFHLIYTTCSFVPVLVGKYYYIQFTKLAELKYCYLDKILVLCVYLWQFFFFFAHACMCNVKIGQKANECE